MAAGFFEHPILNSPYEEPARHHALDELGQPLNQPPVQGRRPSALISPVPAARKQSKRAKQDDLFDQEEADNQQYTLAIINEIRRYVSAWRRLKNPADWGVTPVTQRLLKYWREHEFATVRPFFCQLEAVETAIWLAEVAPRGNPQHRRIGGHILAASAEAQPGPDTDRPQARHRSRQDHRDGDAHRLADAECGQVQQPNVQSRLPDCGARHHHPRPAADSPAEPPRQLLRPPRTRPRRHAARYAAGQDRPHQLPRVQAQGDHGRFQGW